jgi:hypothetical protein
VKFDDFFTESIEYPRDIALNPLPINTEYIYVSTTFLNGFINYVTIKRAWCLNRYLKLEDPYEEHGKNVELKVQEPSGSSKWINILELFQRMPTKREVIEILNQKGRIYHCGLDNDFQDDIIILANARHLNLTDSKMWYYFWFDRDCSDCCIGRFETEMSEPEIFELFDQHVKDRNADCNILGNVDPPTLIEISYFSGWLKG